MNFLLNNFIIFPLIFLVLLLLVRVNTTTTNVDNTTTTTSLHDHVHDDDTGDHLVEAFEQANGIKNKEFRQCCINAGFAPWVAGALTCKYPVPSKYPYLTYLLVKDIDMQAWKNCFTGGYENRACCMEAGVEPRHCLEFCEGSSRLNYTRYDYEMCFVRTPMKAISRCNKDGRPGK